MRVPLGTLRSRLPRGGTLPDAVWRLRHRGVVSLLWAHALFIPAFALVRGYSMTHTVEETAIIPFVALFATLPTLSRRLRTAIASVGLLTCSAILVHLSGGVIEMHFHFFVMVTVVALYQDWLPFLAAIAYVLVHHGAIGAFQATSVFNHYAAMNHPWRWAAIHALFIAGISAVCLVNWRLNEATLDGQRRSRREAEAAQGRLALLAEASKVLASSLELDEVLRDLAFIVVPRVADSCVVFLASDGTIRQVASAGPPSPTGEAFVPPPVSLSEDANPVARVIRTGVSELIDHISPELIEAATTDPQHRAVIAQLGLRSAIVVPIGGRHGTLGALALSTTAASGRALDADDVSLVEELGRRAAVALEHAQLFAGQRTAAETLQHSLLPEVLPEIPGVDIASRYLPGGPDVDIGGDWYDVLALPDGRLALAMGDVVGRGIAAASLMGQLRNALRAYVFDDRSPAETLELLNQLLHDVGAPQQMATLVLMVIDPETGAVQFSNAGHPPPLVHTESGEATFLEHGVGVPLGALAGAEYPDASTRLEPGSTVVLYTDGLVEERTLPLDVGLERLRASVTGGPADLDELCEHLALHAPGEERAQDDLAVLAFRWLHLDTSLHMRLDKNPRVMRPLRATLRRWFADAGATEQEAYEMLVATCEACSNAIKHGTPTASHFELDVLRDGDVTIVVRSPGRWRERRPTSPGGRGLDIMNQFMDDTEVIERDDATEIVMRRTLSASAPPAMADAT